MTRASHVICCTLTAAEAESAEVGEILTAGRQLAETLQVEARWLVVAPEAGDVLATAAKYGVTIVDVIQPSSADPGDDWTAASIGDYVRNHPNAVVVLGQTPMARLVAPRVAARAGYGILMNVLSAEATPNGELSATVRAYGGDVHATYDLVGDGGWILGLMPRMVTAHPAPIDETDVLVNALEPPAIAAASAVRIVSEAKTPSNRIEDASVLVAGGRGLGEAGNFRFVEEAARALGGMAAASRPLVDDGWVDSSRQVGLTGKIVYPDLYVAAGISGASQHMAGCSSARVIVAINRDGRAPIFRYAHYGFVGDAVEFLKALASAAEVS